MNDFDLHSAIYFTRHEKHSCTSNSCELCNLVQTRRSAFNRTSSCTVTHFSDCAVTGTLSHNFRWRGDGSRRFFSVKQDAAELTAPLSDREELREKTEF